jgi:hypothetical protein
MMVVKREDLIVPILDMTGVVSVKELDCLDESEYF